MIFGKNAGLMLKYQKAKAKMVEYDVSKQEYPHFPLNSNELSYPTSYHLKDIQYIGSNGESAHLGLLLYEFMCYNQSKIHPCITVLSF